MNEFQRFIFEIAKAFAAGDSASTISQQFGKSRGHILRCLALSRSPMNCWIVTSIPTYSYSETEVRRMFDEP